MSGHGLPGAGLCAHVEERKKRVIVWKRAKIAGLSHLSGFSREHWPL